MICCPIGASGGIIEGFICLGPRGDPSTRVLGRGFCPLNSWKGWAELFSLLYRRMEGTGVDPGGVGTERVSDKTCGQCCLLVEVEQLEARLAKTQEGMNVFHFLFENDGKMLELGVSRLFVCLLLCLAFFSFCYLYFLKKKDIKGKGEISPPLQSVKMSSRVMNFLQGSNIAKPRFQVLHQRAISFFYQSDYFFPPTNFLSYQRKQTKKGFNGKFWTASSINELPVANVLSFISSPGGAKDVEQMKICSSYRDE